MPRALFVDSAVTVEALDSTGGCASASSPLLLAHAMLPRYQLLPPEKK
jgi:hypothetical protein